MGIDPETQGAIAARPWTAWDISSMGVGLLGDVPAQPVEVLDLHLSGRGVWPAVALRVRAVHAGERHDGR
jgi:hypothetical protein